MLPPVAKCSLPIRRSRSPGPKNRDRVRAGVGNGQVEDAVAAHVAHGDGQWPHSDGEVARQPEVAAAVAEQDRHGVRAGVSHS